MFSWVLGLVRCWFFPETFRVPTRLCSFLPSSSACPSSDLRFPSCRVLPFRRVHGSSRYFSCFLFHWFRAFPLSSVGLVLLFLLQAVVFHLSAFFLFGVPFFPSSRASFRFSLISFPQGPPLGGCVLLLGFWLVCPPLVSLATSHSASFLQAVSSEDFFLFLSFFLSSLLWPGLCW